jgi:hypothetical protein
LKEKKPENLLEVADSKISLSNNLITLHASNANTNVGLKYHADIISSITYCEGDPISSGTENLHYVCFLFWG